MHHQKRRYTPIWHDESVAQQVEHNTFNVGVPGSSPGGFTEKGQLFRLSFFCELWALLSVCSLRLSAIPCKHDGCNLKLHHAILAPNAHSIYRTFSLNGGLRGYLTLLLAYGCAIRYPRFGFAGRAPADSRRKDSHFDCPFLVNTYVTHPLNPPPVRGNLCFLLQISAEY